MHIAEHIHTVYLVQPLLPIISKTFITPNMITIGNILYSILLYYWAYHNHFLLVAIGIQLYLFLDILDGNLARYAQLQSKLGAWLDNTYDRIFYTLFFIFLGIHNVDYILIFILVIFINLYGWIATYYIVPRLKKLSEIKRRPLKKWFMERGFIVGMDVGTLLILTTLFLLFEQVHLLFIVLIIGIMLDIFARLTELWQNMKREGFL